MSQYSLIISQAMEQECQTNPTSQVCENWRTFVGYAPWLAGLMLVGAIWILFLPGGYKKTYPGAMFAGGASLVLFDYGLLGITTMVVGVVLLFLPEIKKRWASVKQSTQEHKENKTMLKGLWHYLNNTRV